MKEMRADVENGFEIGGGEGGEDDEMVMRKLLVYLDDDVCVKYWLVMMMMGEVFEVVLFGWMLSAYATARLDSTTSGLAASARTFLESLGVVLLFVCVIDDVSVDGGDCLYCVVVVGGEMLKLRCVNVMRRWSVDSATLSESFDFELLMWMCVMFECLGVKLL